MLMVIVVSFSFINLLENSQSKLFNKQDRAISNAFMTVLATDVEVKHENPYFYNKNFFILRAEAEFYSFASLEVKEKVMIEGTLIKNYEKGDLFKIKINFPEIQDINYENGTEIPTYLTGDRIIFYFYVMEDKIYRVSPYVYDEEKEQFYVGLNNEAVLIYLLPTDQAVIENSVIVCQDEEMQIVDELMNMTESPILHGKMIKLSIADVSIIKVMVSYIFMKNLYGKKKRDWYHMEAHIEWKLIFSI